MVLPEDEPAVGRWALVSSSAPVDWWCRPVPSPDADGYWLVRILAPWRTGNDWRCKHTMSGQIVVVPTVCLDVKRGARQAKMILVFS